MVSIQRTIQTEQLLAFVAVARKRGISAAADALSMSKSAVSKQLSALEARLQLRLFERTSRTVSLTAEGKGLLLRAESVLAELDQMIEDAHDAKASVRGTLRLAASPEFGAIVAEHFLPALFARHPDLKVSMSSDYGIEDLHEPSVDLAFRLGTVNDDRLVVRQLGEIARILIASPQVARTAKILLPQDLERQRALLFAGEHEHAQWTLREVERPSNTCQVQVAGALQVHGFGAMQAACVGGLGIARMPAFVVADALRQGRLQQVLPRWQPMPVPVHIAYRSGMYRVARVRAAIEAAIELLPQILLAIGLFAQERH